MKKVFIKVSISSLYVLNLIESSLFDSDYQLYHFESTDEGGAILYFKSSVSSNPVRIIINYCAND